MNEQDIQEIVKKVMASMELSNSDRKLGIFDDMNDAIAAAAEAQKVMQKMPMALSPSRCLQPIPKAVLSDCGI